MEERGRIFAKANQIRDGVQNARNRLPVFSTPPSSRRCHRSPRPGPNCSCPPVATPPLAVPPQHVPPRPSPPPSPRRAPVGRSGQISTWAALYTRRDVRAAAAAAAARWRRVTRGVLQVVRDDGDTGCAVRRHDCPTHPPRGRARRASATAGGAVPRSRQ